jgi:hypothetical protein
VSLKTGGLLLIAVLLVAAVACEQLPQGTARQGHDHMELMPYTDAIPAEWGTLVSVTADADWTYSTMWFQDDSGHIRLVGFDNGNRQLLDSVAVILRR